MVLVISNGNLYIDDTIIGDEEKVFHHLEKSIKYDEIKAIFEEIKRENTKLKSENQELNQRLQNVTLWDLSDEEQERAGRALARGLLGGA